MMYGRLKYTFLSERLRVNTWWFIGVRLFVSPAAHMVSFNFICLLSSLANEGQPLSPTRADLPYVLLYYPWTGWTTVTGGHVRTL